MAERKTYTAKEIAYGRRSTDEQVRAFLDLAAEGQISEGFEATYFNNMALSLDRFFVHRLRSVIGNGTTPLNELELISEGLTSEGVLPEHDEIDYDPAKSVLGLKVGDPIELSADQFVELSDAVFAELEAKFER